jgi:predicted protein tyrosine phosphatase
MINVFSRDDMIEHVKTHGVLKDQFYISILSTGGPKGIPIFEDLPNVITEVFDDVEYDCIKTQYPDGTALRFARALTSKQADNIAAFINALPSNYILNIHCVHGASRSVAIAEAIKNKPCSKDVNKRVYKMVKERLDGIS